MFRVYILQDSYHLILLYQRWLSLLIFRCGCSIHPEDFWGCCRGPLHVSVLGTKRRTDLVLAATRSGIQSFTFAPGFCRMRLAVSVFAQFYDVSPCVTCACTRVLRRKCYLTRKQSGTGIGNSQRQNAGNRKREQSTPSSPPMKQKQGTWFSLHAECQ